MLMKAYITAVALAASVLAAPVPESCTSTSATARGLGIICTGAAASKRAPEPVPEPEPESCTSTSATARGLGIICTGAAASKREPVPEPAPEPAPESCSETTVDARGLGIICTGSSASKRDAEEAVEKRTGMGIISVGTDEA